MVWTVITRCEHTRRYARYPSDLTDNEWGVVVPFVPPGRGGGRPRTTDMREVLNAILYLAGKFVLIFVAGSQHSIMGHRPVLAPLKRLGAGFGCARAAL